MGFLKKKFRSIQKLPTWFFWFPAMLIKILRRTIYRVEIIDPHRYLEEARGMVAVTWHNRLLFYPELIPDATRRRTMAVVSASRDGQYIADLVHFFGLRCLRGSSSRKGAHVQLEAIRAIRAGYNVAFTPDGPRGPRYRMQPGPVHLASKLATKVVPIAVNASRYWSMKSWDGFQIPKPFCKLTLVVGEAIPVPSELDDRQFEQCRAKIERVLNEISNCKLEADQ